MSKVQMMMLNAHQMMSAFLASKKANARGATMVEYALILGVVLVIAAFAFRALGARVLVSTILAAAEF